MMKSAFALLVMVATSTTAFHSYAADWRHPKIRNAKLEARQLVIDEGMCTAVATRSVPMPRVMYHADGTHSFAGTATIWGNNGSMSTMTYNVAPIPSPGQAFANGVANGMALGNAIRARMDRQKVYRGCMFSLGWEPANEVQRSPTLTW